MGQSLTKMKSKKVQKYESKEEYFIKNGGILLEKQIALSQGRTTTVAGGLKIFSAKDINRVTNYSEPDASSNHLVPGFKYKRTLDGRVVWIWASQQHHESNPMVVNYILTEVALRLVMNHNSVVRLYGCCLETFMPILVSEYLPVQTLFEHLHGSLAVNMHFKWVERLRVATDASYALSYMHNALSKPIVHRAVSSHSIAVDDSRYAKLGLFAYSVMIDPVDTTRKWSVKGFPGYIDPEYVKTHVVTDKCDVFSVGVLLLEILTRKNPHAMALAGMDLVTEFGSAKERCSMMEMIDPEVVEQASSSEIEQVVGLALRCVVSKGAERPTMIEVVSKLWEVQGKYSN